MNQLLFPLWQRFSLLFAFAFAVSGGLSAAVPEGRTSLKFEISQDRLSVNVTVPERVETVTLMKFQRDGGWKKVASRAATPGVMKFKLPPTGKEVRWRAVGRYKVESAARKKFPDSFYKGENIFGSAKSTTGLTTGIKILDNATTTTALVGETSTVAEESDIWKIDGNTVYFFNQLRGLQVLDLTNPADPRLTASLRLPAVGQDLYLLPGSGSTRNLVLLTEIWTPDGDAVTRLHIVSVSGGKAEIVQTRDAPGSLADSRMVGNRLILATTEWQSFSNGWNSKTRLSEWLLSPDSIPVKSSEEIIDGSDPIIASGPDWLAVSVNPGNRWDISEVSIFAVRPSGLIRMAAPVKTQGSIAGKFAINWSRNVLTTISEKNLSENGWRPVTVLQNFRAWAPEVIHTQVIEEPFGSLELAKGESLYATRFADGKAYVVTFLQTDPLWVVDLSDPWNPKIAGHLEVPGWSSHLEPIGDLLFSVGWESGTVAASLFDVADPASPQLLRRLNLGTKGSYSEALWDEKAIKVLPSAGLAMIPLNTYGGKSGESNSMIQLMDIDLTARDLKLRGVISHAFDARRADLISQSVISISQRELISTDIADRDAPAMLSQVALAWPVDRVLEAGDFLIEIENGGWYGGGAATARIAPSHAPEEILAEFDLGEGTVKTADLRDGKLYITREIASKQSLFYRSPIFGATTGNQFFLDIYDATVPTSLVLLGTSKREVPAGAKIAVDHLLWPRADRPALVMDFRYSYWFGWDMPIVIGRPFELKKASSLIYPPRITSQKSPRIIVYDTAVPSAPTVLGTLALGPEGSTLTGVCEAADGLIVTGLSRWRNEPFIGQQGQFQLLRVVEIDPSGEIVARPLIDLPGALFAITDLDADGFLAFTRSMIDYRTSTYQASACDGHDAFLIDSVEAPSFAAVAAGRRQLFVAQDDGVARFALNEDGEFQSGETLRTDGKPNSLRWSQGTLLGIRGSTIFAASGDPATLKTWNFPTWYLDLNKVEIATDGDLLAPFGEYGAERLER